MKSLIPPLFIFLTLALVAALFVQERQGQVYQTQIADLSRKLIKSEQAGKRQATQIASLQGSQKALSEESQTLRERLDQALEAVRAQAAQSGGDAAPAPTPAEPKPGFAGMIKQMMADPETRKTMLQQQSMVMRQMYGPFLKQAGLSPQEADKFFEILSSRQEAIMDSAASGGAPQPPKDISSELKALLGEPRAAQFEKFEKSLPDQIMVNQLNQQLSPEGIQLSDTQTQGLLQIYADERPKMNATPFKPGSMDGANLTQEALDHYFQQQSELNQRVLARAMGILTQQQIERLKAQQAQNLEMQKMGMRMAKQFLGK
jgi:hypothetical protein